VTTAAVPPGDRILLRGLRGYGRHGVLASERQQGQPFIIDLDITLDTRPAAASDDLADTLDYGAIAQRVIAVVEGEPVALLERLAEMICEAVLVDDRAVGVDVTVHKPSAPLPVPFDDIAVTIRRTRS
jgi:7,8-dihydroneopterin aldolase/epimerase/oxygenase